jgi:hypothetical protein
MVCEAAVLPAICPKASSRLRHTHWTILASPRLPNLLGEAIETFSRSTQAFSPE